LAGNLVSVAKLHIDITQFAERLIQRFDHGSEVKARIAQSAYSSAETFNYPRWRPSHGFSVET
jgi:hypothetical protein